jgi:hypothetical protein
MFGKKRLPNDLNFPFKENEKEGGEGRPQLGWLMEGSNVWWSLESSNVWWFLEGSNVWWSLKGSIIWWPLKGSNVWWPLKGSNVWWPMERKGETSFSPLFTSPPTNFT